VTLKKRFNKAEFSLDFSYKLGLKLKLRLKFGFWATVCKTVRPILTEHCPVCLSVMLVYCGQTVGWMKMPLGTEVGLGPGHTL